MPFFTQIRTVTEKRCDFKGEEKRLLGITGRRDEILVHALSHRAISWFADSGPNRLPTVSYSTVSEHGPMAKVLLIACLVRELPAVDGGWVLPSAAGVFRQRQQLHWRRQVRCLEKNQSAPRPSEHPPVRGKKCQNVHHSNGWQISVWLGCAAYCCAATFCLLPNIPCVCVCVCVCVCNFLYYYFCFYGAFLSLLGGILVFPPPPPAPKMTHHNSFVN